MSCLGLGIWYGGSGAGVRVEIWHGSDESFFGSRLSLHSLYPQAVRVTVQYLLTKAGNCTSSLILEKRFCPKKLGGQVSFGDPTISRDHRTVGWLVMYPDPTIVYYKGAEIAFKLVIFRAGRVLHTFTTEQMFWDWHFQDGGKRVAYSTGPTHGGAAECVLRDVDSGRTVAHWWVKKGSEPPAWAQTLHH